MRIRESNLLLGGAVFSGSLLCLTLALLLWTPYWLLGIVLLGAVQFVLHCPRCGISLSVSRISALAGDTTRIGVTVAARTVRRVSLDRSLRNRN